MRSKTKQIYADSLLDLLKRSSYNVITISEICDNTSLSRRTFYNNFSSKEDVVTFICENYLAGYIEIIKREETLSLAKAATLFCIYGAAQKELVLILIQRNLYHIFVDVGISKTRYIYAHILNGNFEKMSDVHRNYAYLLYSISAFKLFEQWIIGGMRESAEEISQIFISIMRDL